MKRAFALTATLALAGAVCVPEAGAAFNNNDAGTSAAQFLKLGADARSAGMGQAARALCEDANAVYWNPAGLAALSYRQTTLTHAAYYQSTFYEFLATILNNRDFLTTFNFDISEHFFNKYIPRAIIVI